MTKADSSGKVRAMKRVYSWLRFMAIVAALAAADGAAFGAAAQAQAGVDDTDSAFAEHFGNSGRGRYRGGTVRVSGSRHVPDTYTIRRGDTLWDITGRFYGNPWQWPRVWSYNPEITNPHWIYPLDTLRLRDGVTTTTLVPNGATNQPAERRSGRVFLRDRGFLDNEALRTRGVVAGSPQEKMLLTTYDDVYLQMDEGAEVENGMVLTVFSQIDEEERMPAESGELVRIFGAVRVVSYDEDERVARATIIEALDPIERGYQLANIPRRFEMVDPVANGTDIVSSVVATLRPTQLLGEYQVCFIGVGEEEGVRVGNRFFAVREGDQWRNTLEATEERMGARRPGQEPQEYPPEVFAEGRVVSVRPHSAAIMITRSVLEVEVGARVEMREGY